LIGQFVVGFISTFLVENRVFVTSKHNDNNQYIWKSKTGKNFTIRNDKSDADIIRETKVALYLKENLDEFLEEKKMKYLIKKHSEFLDIKIIYTAKKQRKNKLKMMKIDPKYVNKKK
jgi:molecular chaperone HtpG